MLNKKTMSLLKADVIWFFGEGMLGPLFVVFTEKIGGDVLNIARAWATYLIITGVFVVILGKLSDKHINKKKLLFRWYVLNAILTFCYLFVDTPHKLLILQAGLGIAAAMATPTWDALYSQYQSKKTNGLTRGLADGLSELFTGIAVIIGWLIITYSSFKILFIIMGIIQIFSVIMLVPLLKEKD
ncbi:MAG: hypothetical protein ACD_80C00041G0008 [uncultured bacterium (gcode 4)]|uniref:Major facilitator superfamily (MFS) profile domain-containing protein n=1 Tax=uncultured bacterium (gcode 4) TaxID=1234023 RepID=K1YJH3_9BACT|nr:MAG: hypothetical protein ACD_80C00041G0008 [uncultured bacterium (gcode 4)]